MTDGIQIKPTQTFTDIEYEEFIKDAVLLLGQEELTKRLGPVVQEVDVDWDEADCPKDLPSGVEPEFYDSYIVYADKLNPFTLIITKNDDYSDYYRVTRPEDLTEVEDIITQWIRNGEEAEMEERLRHKHNRKLDEDRTDD